MKLKITYKEKLDIPNYRAAGPATSRKCSTCKNFSAGDCTRYKAAVDSDYVCDTWLPNIEAVRDESRAISSSEKGDSFTVFKDSADELRWVSRSSTAYKDRDKEILSTSGLNQAVEWNDSQKSYGPLRWWHMDGVDIGDCDFQMVHGRVLIESGTFRKKEYGEAVQKNSEKLGVSVGFKHPQNEPENGVFNNFLIFERSIMPKGRESNLFTGLSVKGDINMATNDLVKISGLVGVLGEDIALKALIGAEEVQKAADDGNHSFKEAGKAFDFATATPDEIISYGETMKAQKAAEVEAAKLAAETETESTKEVDFSDLMSSIKSIVETAVKEAVNGLQIETQKEVKEFDSTFITDQIKALETQLKELKGEQPKASSSYRASTDPANIVTEKAVVATTTSGVETIADRMVQGFTAHPHYGAAPNGAGK